MPEKEKERLAMKIERFAEETVLPRKATERHVMALSALDHGLPFQFFLLLFFERPQGLRPSAPFMPATELKTSLADALLPYYPLAGRLQVGENGWLELDCNDEGVPFHEATADLRLKDLGEFYQPTPEYFLLVPPVDVCYPAPLECPMLAVQHTSFACGGMCLGLAFNHSCVDGMSSFEFLRTWCQVAQELPISVMPKHDRSIIQLPHPGEELKYTNAGPLLRMGEMHAPTFNFFFSAEAMEDIVDRAKGWGPDYAQRKVEPVPALFAHLWSAIARAQITTANKPGDGNLELEHGNSSEEDFKTPLHLAVGIRHILRPVLPIGYCGNAAAMAKSSNIRLRDVAYGLPPAIYDDVVEALDQVWKIRDNEEIPPLNPPFYPVKGEVLITSFASFPLNGCDFGYGGPSFVTIPPFLFPGRVQLFQTGKDDGSYIATVALSPDQLRALKGDAGFLASNVSALDYEELNELPGGFKVLDFM